MVSSKTKAVVDIKTEDRIKSAARKVFHKKGFAATRTRDIAEEAGINLALLNYYFRSKQKLFDLIMLESFTLYLGNIDQLFNDEHSSLEKKLQLIAEKYTEMFLAEPEIPLFVMSEIRSSGGEILSRLSLVKAIMETVFVRQYKKAFREGRISEPNPVNFIINLFAMAIYPFAAAPLIKKVARLNDRQFNKLMQERMKLIPVWLNAMLKVK